MLVIDLRDRATLNGAKIETGISATYSLEISLHCTMAAEKTPTYTNHDGYRLAKGFPLDGFHSGLKYEAKDEDVFIVTYPKVRTQKL